MKTELEHVLCIDDEADILEVAGMCLETVGGLAVTRCNGGAEGIEKAREVAPDLILLDVMMPGMDDPTTLEKMRADAALEHIPVIFMTARVQPGEVAEYIARGAIAVIEKPFDPMTLAEQVRKAWAARGKQT